MEAGQISFLSFPPSRELFGGTGSLYSPSRNDLCGWVPVSDHGAVASMVTHCLTLFSILPCLTFLSRKLTDLFLYLETDIERYTSEEQVTEMEVV